MTRTLLTLLLILTAALPAAAAVRPRLLVVIVVDQLSAELVSRRGEGRAGGDQMVRAWEGPGWGGWKVGVRVTAVPLRSMTVGLPVSQR